jgi:hypothetical protein
MNIDEIIAWWKEDKAGRAFMDALSADALVAEIERLKGIVDKLPKTADGVPVYPGMRLWLRCPGEIVSGVTRGAWTHGADKSLDSAEVSEDSGEWDTWRLAACYSTREATAAKETPNG